MIRIFRHYISTAYLGLMLAEWIVFYLAMHWGSAVRFLYTSSWYSQEDMILASLVFSIVFTLSCSFLGLYRKTLDREEYNLLERINYSFVVAIFALVFIYYVFPELMLARSVLISALLFTLFGILLTRHLFYRFVNLDKLKRRVLVMGCGKRASELDVINSSYVYRGFDIVGYIALDDESSAVPDPIILSENLTLADVIEQEKVDEVVIAVDDRRKKLPVEDLLDIKMSGIIVMDLQTFYEREQRLVYLKALSPSWLVFSDGFVNDGMRPVIKRSFDVIASVLLLSVSWWVMLLTALAI